MTQRRYQGKMIIDTGDNIIQSIIPSSMNKQNGTADPISPKKKYIKQYRIALAKI